MTWWYRWLCRLSGVLGAFCEYPARERGPPRRPPRMRARPRPSRAPPRRGAAVARGAARPPPERRSGGGGVSERPCGCYGYRPPAWAPEFPGWAGSPGDFPGGNVSWTRRSSGTAPPRPSEREDSAAPTPELSGTVERLLAKRWLSPAGRQPHLLTWAWVGAAALSPSGEGCLLVGWMQVWPDFRRARWCQGTGGSQERPGQ